MGEGGVRTPFTPKNTRKIVRNWGPRGEDGVYLNGTIFDQEIGMLIDTGSAVSILKHSTWKKLRPSGMDLRKTRVQLTGITGGSIQSYGRRDIPIQLGEIQVLQDMEVGDCQDDVILGMDFLRNHVTGIDFVKPSLTIGEQEVELTFYDPEVGKVRVVAAQDVTVAAGTERMITGTSGRARPMEGILSNEALTTDRGWMVARAVVRVTRGQVPVRVINLTEEDIHFRAGAYLGELEPVTDEVQIVRPVRRAEITEQPRDWENYRKLKDMADRTTSGMNEDQQEQVEALLHQFKEAFSDDDGRLGKTDRVLHEINTGDSRPIKQAPRRVPIHLQEEVQTMVDDMKSKGVIEDSTSPWASPIVLVKKKDGTLH